MDDAIVQEQMAYYRARAQEYHESIFRVGRYSLGEGEQDDVIDDMQQALAFIGQLGPYQDILELACGTGIWTRQLLAIGESVTALDASLEMIEVNNATTHDPRVQYQQVNLLAWEPDQQYDLVFFAFWLSHVPPERVTSFLQTVSKAVRPGGQLIIVDQWAPTEGDKQAVETDIIHKRALLDGQTFRIFKVFYNADDLTQMLASCDIQAIAPYRGKYVFILQGSRIAS